MCDLVLSSRRRIEECVLDDETHNAVDLFDAGLATILGQFGELRLLLLARQARALYQRRFNLLKLATEIQKLLGRKISVRDGWRRRQSAHPILVPQQIQQSAIERRLENRNIQLIIRLAMHTKVLNLLERNGLILAR